MGSILSMLWNPTVISAGASGAIFGIFGAMLGFLVLHKESMPVTIYRSVWKSGAAFLAFNLLFAWGVPGIDMAAHVGGAVAGFFGGMVLSQPLDQHTRRTRLWRNALLAGMTVVLLVPAFFYLPVPKGPDADWAVATLEYYRAEEKIIHDYNQLLERIKRKEASEDAMIKLLKEQTLPQWSQWLERMVLIAPTKEPMRSMQPRFITFMRLQKEAWELQLHAVEKQDQAIQDKANAKFAQAARAVQQISPNR